MNRPLVHALGCGRAARSILRWLLENDRIEIGQVCNRSLDSAAEAVEFMGAGHEVEVLDHDITGGWLLLGLPDGELDGAARGMACRMPGQPELAFHLSGSTPASVLEPLGVPVASVHPLRAFADPAGAVTGMKGTWFVAEGPSDICSRLEPVFTRAGGRWLTLKDGDKALYHAATVVASNYLVTLTQLARTLARAAGMEPGSASELLGHLQATTLKGLEVASPSQALTGPIERGDLAACTRLVQAVEQFDPANAQLFRTLALATLDLAIEKRGPKPSDQPLRQLLSRPDP